MPVGDLLGDVTYNGVTSITGVPHKLTDGVGVLADFQTGQQPLTSAIADNKGKKLEPLAYMRTDGNSNFIGICIPMYN